MFVVFDPTTREPHLVFHAAMRERGREKTAPAFSDFSFPWLCTFFWGQWFSLKTQIRFWSRGLVCLFKSLGRPWKDHIVVDVDAKFKTWLTIFMNLKKKLFLCEIPNSTLKILLEHVLVFCYQFDNLSFIFPISSLQWKLDSTHINLKNVHWCSQ